MLIMNKNFKHLIILLLSVTPLFSISQEYPSIHEIKNVIKKEVDNGRSNSIVVGVIDNGKENYICYGNPIEGKLQKADERTIYEIASITKVFVNTIFADLLLKGELSLKDPILKYLPDTLVLQDQKGKEITLKHLATHTSGLPSKLEKIDLRELSLYYQTQSYNDLFVSLEKYKFQNSPGTVFYYSNINTAILAYIICKVNNRDLESLFRERIYEPFQMKNTTLNLTKEQEEYFATGYNRPGRPIEHWEWDAEAGAGGLRSNAQDLITFMRKLFYEDSPLKEAANLAVTVQFDSTRYRNTKIGLGWFITEGKNSLIVGHGGTTHGFKSLIMYDTLNNRGVVVLSNSSREITDIALYVFDKNKKINEFKTIKTEEIGTELFNQIEGTYSFNIGNLKDTATIYERNNLFFIYSQNVGEFEMFYIGNNSFLIEDMKIKFEDFQSDKAQTITSTKKQAITGKRIE